MKVRFLYHHGPHVPGDEVDVDDVEAGTLIGARRAEEVAAAPSAPPRGKAGRKPATDDTTAAP